MQRECGGCTACCKTHGVRELNKPPFTWCKSCEIGVGCTRYDTRPEDCRVFSCAWLIGIGPEDERPDKSKCVASVDLLEQLGDTATIHELRPGASETSALAQDWIKFAAGHNLPVLISPERGRRKLLLPQSFVLTDALRQELLATNTAVHRYHTEKPLA